MITDELKRIKKLYGEDMMHLCRSLFPTILDTPGFLLNVLENVIAPSHSFANDIIENGLENEFKNFILSFYKKKIDISDSIESPFDLMKKAGYTLYECKNEEDIQKFGKYYRDDEIICTIKRGNRLKRSYVFFAVRDNVDEIKRENFLYPKRDDSYGTSVMSIQFARGAVNNVLITNRYNHTVKDQNPDCTLGNNLERIIEGLTVSFEKYYGFNILKPSINPDFLSKYMFYVKANNGKYYSYNCEFDDVYYCENNNIVDHGVLYDKYANNKERYLLMDFYVLDMKDKRIYVHDKYMDDSFTDSINSLGKINRISIQKDGEYRLINMILEQGNCSIKIDKKNKIVSYTNNYVEEIEDNFMHYSDIKEISLSNVLKIKDNFLPYCSQLNSIDIPNVTEIGDNFLKQSHYIERINLPKVNRIGNNLLVGNTILKDFNAPKLVEVGYRFLGSNNALKVLDLPALLFTDNEFMLNNKSLEKINIPNIIYIGSDSLKYNQNINVDELVNKNKRIK